MKRITRFSVSVYNNNGRNKKFFHKWTRGNEIMIEIYNLFKGMIDISKDEWFDIVQSCRENSNVIMDDDLGNTIEVRRWSYCKK